MVTVYTFTTIKLLSLQMIPRQLLLLRAPHARAACARGAPGVPSRRGVRGDFLRAGMMSSGEFDPLAACAEARFWAFFIDSGGTNLVEVLFMCVTTRGNVRVVGTVSAGGVGVVPAPRTVRHAWDMR